MVFQKSEKARETFSFADDYFVFVDEDNLFSVTEGLSEHEYSAEIKMDSGAIFIVKHMNFICLENCLEILFANSVPNRVILVGIPRRLMNLTPFFFKRLDIISQYMLRLGVCVSHRTDDKYHFWYAHVFFLLSPFSMSTEHYDIMPYHIIL